MKRARRASRLEARVREALAEPAEDITLAEFHAKMRAIADVERYDMKRKRKVPMPDFAANLKWTPEAAAAGERIIRDVTEGIAAATSRGEIVESLAKFVKPEAIEPMTAREQELLARHYLAQLTRPSTLNAVKVFRQHRTIVLRVSW